MNTPGEIYDIINKRILKASRNAQKIINEYKKSSCSINDTREKLLSHLPSTFPDSPLGSAIFEIYIIQ